MEWNEIEKKWRDKQKRQEVKPSDEAWELLSKQLNSYEPKRRVGYLKWFSIAACLLFGGYMLNVLLFSSSPDVLKPEIKDLEKTVPTIVYENKEVEKKDIEQGAVNVKEGTKLVSEGIEKMMVIQMERREKKVEVKEQLYVVYDSKEIETDIVDLSALNKVNPETVEIKINPNLLLDQVEGELEMEFRETKVEKIYETAKRAIVGISNSRYEK